MTVGYLAEASVRSGLSSELSLVLISAALTVIGAVVLFDLFGFVTKYRVPMSPRSIQRGWPDPAKVVGGVFLVVGVLGLAFCLVVAAAILVRHLAG
jgi:hypothetical protein